MRHYGDVREPVISDAQIRVLSETSMPFTLPSKSSYLDSFFIALTISTRSERYKLIHRLIINTFLTAAGLSMLLLSNFTDKTQWIYHHTIYF